MEVPLVTPAISSPAPIKAAIKATKVSVSVTDGLLPFEGSDIQAIIVLSPK
jgi:hypothetical protein